ncbi:MAG: hypothetical protein COU07_03740 [Candidatus Harrisonbacteria bacterium CG10_big_fil_rev_8_21_14_0_10_40_38]|uniref:Membrane insertase YidC/Oxa/ALB C-terminal domain-containing protein n=1 Tax=Candidatus Harrisonbacteria bacterium CG10_big_fil_rev_8_21_14_0_10_40_38 TaxID=1974583 RepID=A0A2H0URF0_9BACT|nr:MAG: hypothetical protein COU07_03740 [Candidatus Harrisonbacteria bacterium CG10_big_fil_rev_8_21_14_0_10_40_38]
MFHEIFYRPLLNALIFLYEHVAFNDFGVAIILLTIIIRLILYPLFYKSFKSQALIQKIQPEIKKIQKEFKDKRDVQAEKLMNLYRDHGISPFSTLFPIFAIIIQLPILIALYRVFLGGITPEVFSDLYSFVAKPDVLNTSLFGLINLENPNILIVGLAAVFQYIQGKVSVASLKVRSNSPEIEAAERMGKTMVFVGPLLTIVFFYSLPAAIGVYWTTTSVFSILQQLYINKTAKDTIHKNQNGESSDNNPTTS